LKDGAQAPDQICDGVSIGIGFDAVLGQIGDVVTEVPYKGLCDP
jgi:hypothetical protein